MANDNPYAIPGAAIVKSMKPEMIADLVALWGGLFLYWKQFNPPGIPEMKSFWYHAVKVLCQYQSPPVSSKEHWTKIPSADRRNLALYLHRNIRPLLEGIQAALEAEEAERERVRELLAVPLAFERVRERSELLKEVPTDGRDTPGHPSAQA
jgi:hypothetical protein